ncbi:ATP-grasp domain-containing protein [Streptomyces sp. DSM 44915]|uniref:ATP-grasp domain-containing protein n=1 Tax=Streptomyces chisholmiae TaxID=3075540 RepID=A0ABU2JY57_9ACTN|nr:ATP-grasp domain-containing protein [Streptomyces sp. DSM 44915]MDT0269464.1 ATP-grasp domain-containing protein [Streptomyces sp. DSM 44915]
MNEHVLVVGTGGGPAPLLRELGATTTLMCRIDFLGYAPALSAHHAVLGVAGQAADEQWTQLAKSVDQDRPFTRVVAFGELDQDRAAAVAGALGLPGHDPETVRLVADKRAMRERLRERGVDPTPSALVADAGELLAFLAEHGGPVVVKPLQGAGSVGVTVLREPDEAAAVGAFDRAAAGFAGVPRAGVLAERFHEGPQFSVEALSEDGEHQVLAVVRKFYEPDGYVELGHLAPAGLDAAAELAVAGLVAATLDALGVGHGPTHTEVVLTAAGPRVIETHLRLAGDEIPELVGEVTGLDYPRLVARQALGQRVLPEVRAALADPGPERYSAIWFTLPTGGGTLVAAEPPPPGAVPAGGSVETHPLLDPGDEIAHPANSDSRVAATRSRAGTAAEAVRAARAAAEAVRVRVAPPLVTRVLGTVPADGGPA